MDFSQVILEREQQDLFIQIVDIMKQVPRENRGWMIEANTKDGTCLIMPKINSYQNNITGFARGDLEMIAEAGLMKGEATRSGGNRYVLKPIALKYYDWLLERQGNSTIKGNSPITYSFDPSRINPKIREVIDKIEVLKRELDRLSPMQKEYEVNLLKKVHLEWTYHSCKLEGNELTYGETRELLEYNRGTEKSFQDQREIKGHEEAILYVENLVENNGEFTENFIRELNIKVLKEPYPIPAETADGVPTTKTINPGQYKTTSNHVETKTGDIFEFSEHFEVSPKMQELVAWFTNEEVLHPLVKATEFHYRFIRIHPFDDGNGRVSRLLMNYSLMRDGLPPIIIRSDQKDTYLSCLRKADIGEFESLFKFLGNSLINSLELYISAARGEDINEYADLDKRLKVFSGKLLQDGKDEIRVKRSKEIITERFDDSIWPFFKTVIENTKKFYPYFAEHELQYMVDRTHHGNNWDIFEIKEKLRNSINEKEYLREMGIEIRLIAFKKVTENPWTQHLKTTIEFQDHLYIINPHHHNGNTKLPQIKKLYDKQLSEKEIEDYVKEDGNSIMDAIEAYYNSFNSEVD